MKTNIRRMALLSCSLASGVISICDMIRISVMCISVTARLRVWTYSMPARSLFRSAHYIAVSNYNCQCQNWFRYTVERRANTWIDKYVTRFWREHLPIGGPPSIHSHVTLRYSSIVATHCTRDTRCGRACMVFHHSSSTVNWSKTMVYVVFSIVWKSDSECAIRVTTTRVYKYLWICYWLPTFLFSLGYHFRRWTR